MPDLTQESFADLAAPGPRRGERPLPDGARIDRCRSCDAEIVWVRTEDGKAMPLSLATAQRRDAIGIELNEGYIDLQEQRTNGVQVSMEGYL